MHSWYRWATSVCCEICILPTQPLVNTTPMKRTRFGLSQNLSVWKSEGDALTWQQVIFPTSNMSIKLDFDLNPFLFNETCTIHVDVHIWTVCTFHPLIQKVNLGDPSSTLLGAEKVGTAVSRPRTFPSPLRT